MKKTEYYSMKKTVDRYNQMRYGGKSGVFVMKKELECVKNLLPDKGKILDIPSGTGKLRHILGAKHYIVGADFSKEMLRLTKGVYNKNIRADASNLPFKDKSFDAVVSLRFLFHYKGLRKYILEFKRVLKDDGVMILERYRWSPLKFNFMQYTLGGANVIHKKKDLNALFKELGLEVIAVKRAFLFSPFVYRYLPFFAVRLLDWLESILPASLRVDEYIKLKKV